mmetsp:Transcript_157020/g.301260  ORF Transcript_157020/g.301260 Transcript_157020/m.301260 type:complete len:377 (-) Transcript_157020:195-1325(-)
MNKLSLAFASVLACLVCIACGLRAQSNVRQLQGRPFAVGSEVAQAFAGVDVSGRQARASSTQNLVRMLAVLTTFNPASAFNPSLSPVSNSMLPSRSHIYKGTQPPTSSAASRSTPQLDRAALLKAASALVLSWQAAGVAHADTSTASAVVTDKVELVFQVQYNATYKQRYPITFGLFGKDAPEAVSLFKNACSGFAAPCAPPPDVSDKQFAKDRQLALLPYQSCKTFEEVKVTYYYSEVWSILPGKRINAGDLSTKFVDREFPNTTKTESASLSHDAAGLLSVPRQGGVLDFGITTAPAPEDDQQYKVIGRVLEGMESVAAIGDLPIVNAAPQLNVQAEVPATSKDRKACVYGGNNAYCSQNKPLKKTILVKTTVL